MREIKYRAYHKKYKAVYEVSEINFESRYMTLKSGEFVIDDVYFDEIEIMQYTGLKDKNGVEIYEGDYVLVEVDDAFYYGDFVGIVRFIDGSWVVDKPNEELIDLFSETNEIDILGNIYENPELLGG